MADDVYIRATVYADETKTSILTTVFVEEPRLVEPIEEIIRALPLFRTAPESGNDAFMALLEEVGKRIAPRSIEKRKIDFEVKAGGKAIGLFTLRSLGPASYHLQGKGMMSTDFLQE